MLFPNVGKHTKRALAAKYAAIIILGEDVEPYQVLSPRSITVRMEEDYITQEDFTAFERGIYAYIRDGFTVEYFRPTNDNQYIVKIVRKCEKMGAIIPGITIYDMFIPVGARYEIKYDAVYGQYPIIVDQLTSDSS
jgi:hypothetical protein